MAPKALCKAEVKTDAGKRETCGKTLLKREFGAYYCPNYKEHILPFVTGFCAVKACEGAHRKDAAGRNMKTCEEWKHCPCQCHTLYDTMFLMSDSPRVVIDNSGYVPAPHTYWVPTPEERAMMLASSSPRVTSTPTLIESPAPGVVPATIARTFAPTVTGRAARGELESWVKRVCDEWLVEEINDLCTPGYVARCVAKNEGLGKEPSVGAISAVWDRWVSLGFAVIEKKPTRFLKYTTEGALLGLEVLKERARSQRRMATGANKRSGRA